MISVVSTESLFSVDLQDAGGQAPPLIAAITKAVLEVYNSEESSTSK